MVVETRFRMSQQHSISFSKTPLLLSQHNLRCRDIVSFLSGSFYYRDSEEIVATFSTICRSQFRLLLLLFFLIVMLIPAKQEFDEDSMILH